MSAAVPRVRVVVINYDGGDMTIDCLRSLQATKWPADRLEIVLVDNGSIDDVVEQVRADWPEVRLIEPLANTGFARGCNLGIQAPGEWDFVALVNNDAVVEPDWLQPLVTELQCQPRLGAVSPKMVFDGRYVEVAVEAPHAAPHGNDVRSLGVRFTAFRLDGQRADGRISFDEGFFPAEPPHAPDGEEVAVWSWRRGHVRVRVHDSTPAVVSMRVSGAGRSLAHLRSETAMEELTLTRRPTWVDLPLGGRPFDVINNAGSALYPGGFGGDRGFLERDRGQYDVATDVFAWCGGAVLLRREYLADVGLFDERLFLYYEDTDLSWRGRLRGWDYRFVPSSRVRHRHAQTSGAGSPVFRYQTGRNRALVLAKNAPAPMAARAAGSIARDALTYTARHVVLRAMRMRRPLLAEARLRWRVLGGYLRLLPGTLLLRWRATPTVDRRSILRWQITKEVAA